MHEGSSALALVLGGDPALYAIVALSLIVSVSATLLAAVVGLPLGALLVMPILAALTRQTIEDLWAEYRDELTAMRIGPLARVMTLLWDARFSLTTTMLAGFGRAAAEVGTVMIVGGNIDGLTRTMTTAIALETSKGDLPLALGLGLILISLIVLVNAAAWGVRRAGEIRAG